MTSERAAAFDFFGPRSLTGPELKPGDVAPDFALINNKLETVTKATYAGKPLLISVVPSLDTGVCSKQTVRFNEEAAQLAEQANFVTVSADLPFAQIRWCGSNNADAVQALSDHRDMSFGAAYGTLLGDFRIESRAVFVVDAAGTISYVEYVPVAGQEPDYDKALAALKALLG
ncbi:redoxin domain-containing protein [Oscillochloris trichoides DG-6]|uniref:Redoxin domain-containing protein n=1 Tax=Oscillochloris trichoides DG-6 TaxID=765420 RepID=E1IE22_9CHLR|nr:thiol peroxidase [Oscillochloris trichoides]EFO80564.1 redoxin domain-containing protein [Oscillochloris trichoides DG-6]